MLKTHKFTKIIEEKMLKAINEFVNFSKINYDANGWNKTHELNMSQLAGMISMLTLVTDKEYVLSENRVKEMGK